MPEKPFSIYDVGARFYTFDLQLTRDSYFGLVRLLTETYPNSKYESERFVFSASKEQFCEIGTDYVQVVELSRGNSDSAVDMITRVMRTVCDHLGCKTFDALDVSVSGLLDVVRLSDRNDLIYFSGYEFLQSYLFHQVDVSNLGMYGELEGLGFQFAFNRQGDKHSIRVSPFEKDKRFLFMDLQLALKEQQYGVTDIRPKAKDAIHFLEKEIVPFLEHVAHIRATGKKPEE